MTVRRAAGLLILGVVLLLLLPSAAMYYTDWLWFKELGYEGVFLRTLNAQTVVFATAFVLAFVFLYVNFRIARRAVKQPRFVLGTGADGRPIVIEGQNLARLAIPVSLVIAFGVAVSSSANWLGWLSFFNATPFGDADPIFGWDTSYYVFRLPIYQILRGQLMAVTVLTLVGCGLLYVLSGSFVLEARFGVAFWPRVRLVTPARRHLALLGAVIFGLMAWGARLDMASTLLNQTAVGHGASYADVYARLPVLRVTIAVLGLGSLLSIWHGFGTRTWMVPLALGMYVLTSIGGSIYAVALQNFVVTPNEQSIEQPYIKNNILATRHAYDLDKVDTLELSGDATLTPQNIISNEGTIENVRLWDQVPLLQTFGQIQEIRTYYDFINVDNDRYTIDGKYRQVMLSVRELNPDLLPNRSWVNEHLTFTHGYGLTLGPVNLVMSDGTPVLFVKDLPPVTTVHLPISEPGIYFGELTKNYALVKTGTPEFDYPRVNDNVTTVYHGTGGVPVGGFFRRLLFALRFATTDILVTGQISKDSRIMYHREIGERVEEIAPFLHFDPDPYPVVSDGRIFWIQDAYTTSANYPYSTPSGPLNYIRNSAKIVIDAYNGTTTFYMSEPNDPVVQTLARVFPGLFHPLSDMPAGLREHIRYPEEIFKIQAAVFATYHMTNSVDFYNKEDQWQVPGLDTDRTPQPMQPYYTIMKLPGEKQNEFIQMLPFTPRAKDNLSAWLVARSDGANYGHLRVFQFPKQKIIYGPKQIVSRINQDQTISPQITLWGQQGSEVIWGTLMVIPVEESLLYVRPLYLRGVNGKMPALKEVIVAYQDKIVMGETLSDCLIKIFGQSIASGLPVDRLPGSATVISPVAPETPGVASSTTPAPIAVGADATMLTLVNEARTHFERAQKALTNADFATYGDEIKKVGEILDKLAKTKK